MPTPEFVVIGEVVAFDDSSESGIRIDLACHGPDSDKCPLPIFLTWDYGNLGDGIEAGEVLKLLVSVTGNEYEGRTYANLLGAILYRFGAANNGSQGGGRGRGGQGGNGGQGGGRGRGGQGGNGGQGGGRGRGGQGGNGGQGGGRGRGGQGGNGGQGGGRGRGGQGGNGGQGGGRGRGKASNANNADAGNPDDGNNGGDGYPF